MSNDSRKPGFSGRRDPSLDWARRPVDALELSGKQVVVVGGTNGLGRAIARVAAARRWRSSSATWRSAP